MKISALTRKIIHQAIWYPATAGATASIGLLALVGAHLINPTLLFCTGALVLAAAYENQVNGEGIEEALDRILDPDYLRLGIVENFFDDLLESKEQPNNAFFNDYCAQRNNIGELKKRLRYLQNAKAAFLPFFEKEQREQIQLLIEQKEEELTVEKQRLRRMHMTFLSTLTNAPTTPTETAALALAGVKKEELLKEMQRKAYFIKLSWIFSIGAGISSGLATFSAMKIGVISFTALSVIPGGAIFALCALAAIGYTLLIYQSITEMIQKYGTKATAYFKRRDAEADWMYALRCTATAGAIALALFATFATAGTWWFAAKHGATMLGAAKKTASILRDVVVSLMILPTLIFNVFNSNEAVDKIFQSNYIKRFKNFLAEIGTMYKEEVRSPAGLMRFLNPFRFITGFINFIAPKGVLLLHTLSIGASSDRVMYTPATVSASLSGGSELLTDLNYLPDEEDNSQSTLLTILFIPIKISVFVLNVIGALWDYGFSGFKDIKTSFKKMFCSSLTPIEKPPLKAELTTDWHRQEIKETCNEITKLMPTESQKYKSAQAIRAAVEAPGELKLGSIRTLATPFSIHRNSMWKKGAPDSQRKMDQALDSFSSRVRR